jgi:hypothetical protein
MIQISVYNFVYPKKTQPLKIKSLKYFFQIRTNGNAAILNVQIDLNIPGGTYNTSPLCCTTAFTFIVLSNFSSALYKQTSFFQHIEFSKNNYLLYRRTSGIQIFPLGKRIV